MQVKNFLAKSMHLFTLEFPQLCQRAFGIWQKQATRGDLHSFWSSDLNSGAVHITFFGRPLGHSGNCLLFFCCCCSLKITFHQTENYWQQLLFKGTATHFTQFPKYLENCVKKLFKQININEPFSTAALKSVFFQHLPCCCYCYSIYRHLIHFH